MPCDLLSNPILTDNTPEQLGSNAFKTPFQAEKGALNFGRKKFQKFNYLGFLHILRQIKSAEDPKQIKGV
jgi:hypothetical protein